MNTPLSEADDVARDPQRAQDERRDFASAAGGVLCRVAFNPSSTICSSTCSGVICR